MLDSNNVQEVQITIKSVYVGGSQISSNPYEWTKILETTKSYECTTGRQGVRLQCGWIRTKNERSYFTDYTLIYLTLPAFSAMFYQKDSTIYSAMPWIKVNGEWKRALQYVKVNGEWKKYHSSWIWNPEA